MTAVKNFRVDSFIASLAIKAPCRVVSNANLTLSAEQTVNGVPVLVGDRVLVKDQTDTTENGVYNVETAAWQRTGDFDGNRDATNGTLIIVNAPTSGLYQLSATDPVEIGTSSLSFALAMLLDLDQGNFVASWSDGFTTVPTTTFNYVRSGDIVTLSADVTFTATSNNTIFDSASGDVPAALRPSKVQRVLCVVEDNGSDSIGALSIGVNGILQFSLGVSGGAFTATGAKGIPQRVTMTYAIN